MVERQTERVALRITPTEASMLEDLKERSGLNATDYLRMLIRAEHARTFGEPPAKPRTKRK